MANLIPYYIDKKAPASEKKIFDIIKNDPRMDDWVVFHSLRLENHINQFNGGEADFVILAPNLGCFVIEIKGGEDIIVENRVWKTKDCSGATHVIKNPFKQVSDNRFSIIEYLDKKNISHPFFQIGVAFPDTIFNVSSIEYSKEQIFDASYKNNFFDYIRLLARYYENKMPNRSNSPFRAPTANEIRAIRNALSPNYDAVAPLSVKISNNNDRIIKLTEEQYDVLDDLIYCDSAIIHGPAGTGKTLLAVELAKRKASRNNVKVALISYTLLLTNYLKHQVETFNNIDVFSISDFFEKKRMIMALLMKIAKPI